MEKIKKKNYKLDLENLIESKIYKRDSEKKIDILINNAGISTIDNALTFNLKKMTKIHNINFILAIISKSVLKNMIKKNGQNCNITSIFAEYVEIGCLIYRRNFCLIVSQKV